MAECGFKNYLIWLELLNHISLTFFHNLHKFFLYLFLHNLFSCTTLFTINFASFLAFILRIITSPNSSNPFIHNHIGHFEFRDSLSQLPL
ncbi:hypothetical protein Lalb_Chr04g0259491 [Lupinus albus]|uniref:Uncharacterized protein n=1 Tax=Lupinus albus TaxID=3870 RepID=A0A6A4QQL3_LUPAL|nr:hypothetical protein Lalb_Chr04g0259491 [Lupinus albus]